MIKINIEELLFSKSFLNLKYKTKITQALKNIKEKYKKNKLDFLDVDKIIDIEKIENFVKNKKDNFENIVILWIWGSALWTKAIFQWLKWKYFNELSRNKRENSPRLYILDNIDPDEINDLIELLDYKKTLFIIISKSGSTIETSSMFSFFRKKILENNLELKNHFVIIAWENSSFKKKSLKEGFEVFDIPEWIWGRFSVLTPVWLLPLAFVWIDIRKILSWVSHIKSQFFSSDLDKNISLFSAIINYHSHIELWKNILVLFPYISNLYYFGEWYKQLLAESLGKGGLWFTPVTAIWVTDQHSQLQLYYDWPNDKILNFIELEKSKNDFEICCNKKFTFKKLLDTEKFWTEKSITDYNKINYTIKIENLDEETIWELIIFYEMQIVLMAEFFWVNAFDQPWVEIWKNITKQKLLENIGQLEILEQTWTKNIVFIGWWNGQSSILKIFKQVVKNKKEKLNTKYNISSIVAMSDDWRTTWMLMKSFKKQFWLHLPPPWDLRRILFTLSNSKYKDYFLIIFNKIFNIDENIWNYTIFELFKIVSNELIEESRVVDLKSDILDFLNNKWEIFDKIINIDEKILNFRLPLDTKLKWHKFWNILMTNLYYNFWNDYNKMLDFMKDFLEVEDGVLPITIEKATIKAILENWEIIKTQDKISNIVDYNSNIEKIELLDKISKPSITKNIKNTIKNADYIIIGPWDLYTSIIANFLVEGLTKEIENSDAEIIYILNANNKKWETTWYRIENFIDVIWKYIWDKNIDYVIWNNLKPDLTDKQLKDFKNDISVKWWEYLLLDEKEIDFLKNKYRNIKFISWEYINSKDLYKYNENIIKDLVKILK